MTQSQPPLRIVGNDGAFSQIPTYILEFSGATVTRISPTQVRVDIDTSAGAIMYAPTGGSYITIVGEGDLSNERVLTSGSSVEIRSDATTVTINALTNIPISGASYITALAEGDLSGERILTSGSSIEIRSDATTITVNALTGTSVSYPLEVDSGGTG